MGFRSRLRRVPTGFAADARKPECIPDPRLKPLLQSTQNHSHVVGLLPVLQEDNAWVDGRNQTGGDCLLETGINSLDASFRLVVHGTALPSSPWGDERQSCGIVGISHDPSSNQLGFGQAE
ncbi:protein of unknown function (plasmid) [Aminobacter niigataensis]|nr:protein of unknown function [Aminobacter niigataensis]